MKNLKQWPNLTRDYDVIKKALLHIDNKEIHTDSLLKLVLNFQKKYGSSEYTRDLFCTYWDIKKQIKLKNRNHENNY